MQITHRIPRKKITSHKRTHLKFSQFFLRYIPSVSRVRHCIDFILFVLQINMFLFPPPQSTRNNPRPGLLRSDRHVVPWLRGGRAVPGLAPLPWLLGVRPDQIHLADAGPAHRAHAQQVRGTGCRIDVC